MSDIYLKTLENVLKKDDRLVSEDGRMLKAKVAELARALDSILIKSLLRERDLKELFFKKIDSILIFDKDKFVTFIENEAFLPDSYTAYKNKIGLGTNNDDYVIERNEIVLNWPYKDCVLEGGQEKEEQRRNEIFWNETLGADQRDVLLAPKVLAGFKRFDKEGEHDVTELKDTDNLIIKGNNLLTLYTLKKRFAGKVKLIYIDPPFNTGNDDFKYNDSFKHSTWLTFMKNRLEISRELLADDGVIFVHIDWNENHYLKILMDEVFGRDNFINEIVWKRRGGALNQPKLFGNVVDYILFYSKTRNYQFHPQKSLEDENTKKYIRERFIFKDEKGRMYMKSPLSAPEDRPTLKYSYKGYSSPPTGWLVTQEKLEQWDKEGRLVFPKDKNQRISRKIFLDEYMGQPINCLWTDIYVINPMAKESLDFVGQKPEELLKRIIETSTKEGDIVLDFFLGSGTTAAVAHKIGRQYIGIEQIYYDHDSLNRLQDVIKGDGNGISKTVKWKGGGSFVYAHLKNDANIFIEAVQNAKNGKELLELLQTIKSSNFLSYRADPPNIHDEEFSKLPEEQQKRLLIELVDKNKLYVNFHDIDDKSYKIDENTKKLNQWLQCKQR